MRDCRGCDQNVQSPRAHLSLCHPQCMSHLGGLFCHSLIEISEPKPPQEPPIRLPGRARPRCAQDAFKNLDMGDDADGGAVWL